MVPGARATGRRRGRRPHRRRPAGAFAALAAPLVAAFLEKPPVADSLRRDITSEAATEWLMVVATGLLTTETPDDRSRAEHIDFLRQFVAYSLLEH